MSSPPERRSCGCIGGSEPSPVTKERPYALRPNRCPMASSAVLRKAGLIGPVIFGVFRQEHVAFHRGLKTTVGIRRIVIPETASGLRHHCDEVRCRRAAPRDEVPLRLLQLRQDKVAEFSRADLVIH